MDNAQKAIMIGVGLFITIIIISAVLLIVNLGTGLVDDATAELSSMSSSLQNQILQNYDGKIVSGTQVRGALQQYMTSTDVSIVLVNAAGDAVAGIGAKNLTSAQITITPSTGRAEILTSSQFTDATVPGDRIPMTTFTDIDNAGQEYVNTSLSYNSYVIRVSDVIVGIVFVPSSVITEATGNVVIG